MLKLLPYGWDQQARVLRAFCRTRELQHPALLLRALLAYVLCCGCFNLLGAWALLLGIADISDTAWRRRFIAASLWLDWLLRQLLSENAAPPAPAEDPQPASERVVIIDSTIIVHPTGKGEDWRIHLGFDLSNARFDTMLLTDDHTSEDTAHYPLGRGDIAIADAGHGRRRLIVHTALQQQAQLVVRIHPRTCPLMDAAGEQVNIVAWLRTLKGRYHSRQLYCHYGKQRVGLRLIAVKLSDQASKKAQRRKRKKAVMDRRKITEETLFLAGWVLLVTNLPGRAWPTDAVVRLYRARWQVELMFKQMKQMIMLGKLKVRNRAMGQAVLRAKLVAWALGEKISGGLRELLPKGGGWQRRPVSSWALRSLGLGQLRQAVGSGWTQERLEACMERLLRYICGRPRRRQHQESRIRAWLSRRMQAIEGMFLDASLSTTKRVA
ncbi:MAG TPA: transposase [Chloroflexia bacterium]|nr:transposase [Chloroflexia bacterium]